VNRFVIINYPKHSMLSNTQLTIMYHVYCSYSGNFSSNVRSSYTSLCKGQRECVRMLSAARKRLPLRPRLAYSGSIKNNFQRTLFEIVHKRVSVAYKITDNEHHEWLPFPFISHVSNVQIARALFDVKEHWFSAYHSVIDICSTILRLPRWLDHSNSC